MKQTNQKTSLRTLKKSLGEMKGCLEKSIDKRPTSNTYKLKFSRLGTQYRLDNAPIPSYDKIGLKLELSFNAFMNQLEVAYDGIKVEGMCLIDKEKDGFVIGYQNYKKKGAKIVSNLHKIKGMV